MATATRSAPNVWLVGKATKQFSSSRLATNGDVIRCLLFHHLEENLTLKHSIHSTIEEFLVIRGMARIPTQRVDSGEKKLSKLYNTYQLLKKKRTKAFYILHWHSTLTPSNINNPVRIILSYSDYV